MKGGILVCCLFTALLVFFNPAWAKRLDNKMPTRLIYAVKLGVLTIGRAEIEDLGLVNKKDLGKVKHLRVRVSTPQFKDEENIYANPDTLYPIKIKRNLVYLGRHEQIVELYDQEEGYVRILKNGKETVLQQEVPIDNVFLLIFRSQVKGIDGMDEEKVNLPTASYKIKVEDGKKIYTKMGVFDVYLVRTFPSKIKLWFDKDKGIPVRVAGAIPMLPYVLSIISMEE